MSDIITLTGIVATIPRALTTGEGLAITSFRLASSQRKFDKTQERWVDGETNWYTITTFRQLATNSAVSVHKGDRIVVTGRLRIRDWQAGEKAGTNIEVDAEALGHDLSWGTAAFSRNMGSAAVETTSSGFPSEIADQPEHHEGQDQQQDQDQAQLIGVAAGSSVDIETPF
jgi:single-strand DNA-binding protein